MDVSNLEAINERELLDVGRDTIWERFITLLYLGSDGPWVMRRFVTRWSKMESAR